MDNIKRFVIKKYVMANSAMEAIKREKLVEVDDLWIDEDWKKEHEFESKKKPTGF